jgi:hypothetical protein
MANAGVLTAPFIHQDGPQPAISNAGWPAISDHRFYLSSAAEHQTTLIDAYSSPTTLRDNDLLALSPMASGSSSPSELDEILVQPGISLTATSSASPLQVTTSGGDSATAIPLPPAIQSGITGIIALGMAWLFRSVRRALR